MLELVLPLIKLGWRVKQINVVVTNLFISTTKLAYVDTRFQKKFILRKKRTKVTFLGSLLLTQVIALLAFCLAKGSSLKMIQNKEVFKAVFADEPYKMTLRAEASDYTGFSAIGCQLPFYRRNTARYSLDEHCPR